MLTDVDTFGSTPKQQIFWMVEDVAQGSGPKSTYKSFERGEFDISATQDSSVAHQGVIKNGTCFDIEFLESTRHGTSHLKGT